SPSRATLTGWQPGRMTVTLDPAPPQPSYLLIAENWYPDWEATVDGQPAPALRGDYSLLTVALPAGAKVVALAFRSKPYELGRAERACGPGAEEPRVTGLHREGKLGLGTAYITGFRWALERGYDYVFEMDADFSHDPVHLKEFLKAVVQADLVLGSRYLNGKVTVVNWPMGRLLLSYCANIYARWITGLRIWDLTGGFKCFRRRVLEAIDLSRVRSNGYAFQIEMSVRAWRKGFTLKEVPIVFVDRTEGQSKM